MSVRRDVLTLVFLVSAAVTIPLVRDLLSAGHGGSMLIINAIAYALLLLTSLLGWYIARLSACDVGVGNLPASERLLGCLLLGGVFLIPVLIVPARPMWPTHIPLLVVAVCVEEVLCRGVIQALTHRLVGPGGAVACSALVFSAMHAARYPVPTLLVGLAAGLILAVWKQRSGDLLAPMVGHLCADVVASVSL